MLHRYARAVAPLLAAVTVLQLTGCNVFGLDGWVRHRWTLEQNRDRWEDLAVRSYRFTFSESCECIPGFIGAVQITVEDGIIAGVTPLRATSTVSPEQWSAFPTIDELFSLVEEAIRRRAHQFHVEYEPARGYPVLINLDFDGRAVDDELVIHVRDFVAAAD